MGELEPRGSSASTFQLFLGLQWYQAAVVLGWPANPVAGAQEQPGMLLWPGHIFNPLEMH